MKKAVIFDLDGTLWDSTEDIYKVWNSVFERHHDADIRLNTESMSRLMGKTMPEIGAVLFPSLCEKRRMEILNECAEEENIYLSAHGAILYEGLEETLRELSKEYELYIVSNCQNGYIEAFFAAHKLGSYFKDYEMSGRTGLTKGPNIRLIIERNGVDRCFYIGDTAGDESAAREAGVTFVYASYGFGSCIAPDAVISSIKELPDTARTILNAD